MNLTSEFTIPATVSQAWAAFNHVELLAQCLPGAILTSLDGENFDGSLGLKLGPSTLTYTGTGSRSERHLGGRHTVVELDGLESRGRGTVSARITTSFEQRGITSTTVKVSSDVTFTGPPAQLSTDVVQDASDRLSDLFAAQLTERLRAGLAEDLLVADADGSALGDSGGTAGVNYLYNPPAPASQSDYDVFVKVAPVWAKRLAGPVLGGVGLLWLIGRVRRRG